MLFIISCYYGGYRVHEFRGIGLSTPPVTSGNCPRTISFTQARSNKIKIAQSGKWNFIGNNRIQILFFVVLHFEMIKIYLEFRLKFNILKYSFLVLHYGVFKKIIKKIPIKNICNQLEYLLLCKTYKSYV